MSPMWLLLGAPGLLLPLGVVFLLDDEAAPSMVEQAIAALPIPGDASDGDGISARLTPLGTSAARLPPSMSLALYNNSARAAASRLGQHDDAPDPQRVVDLKAGAYALLHPRGEVRDDLLIGDYALIMTMPMGGDLSLTLFREYCSAQPGDATFSVSLAQLPINPALVTALTGSCPRLG